MPPHIPVRPADTTPDAERVQVALLQRASVARRLHGAFGLSATVIGLARRSIARAQPSAGPRDVALRFVELHYGPTIAAAVRHDLERRDRDGARSG